MNNTNIDMKNFFENQFTNYDTCEAQEYLMHNYRATDSKVMPLITHCEQGVLEILAVGKTYKEIAIEKHISVDTVKKHCTNIYRKLGVGNKTEAINMYHAYHNR